VPDDDEKPFVSPFFEGCSLISPQEESIKDEENFDNQVKSSESVETVEIEDKPHTQNLEKSESLEKVEKSKLVTSKSAEKIVHEKSGHQQQHVRTSKSQELKSDDEFAIVFSSPWASLPFFISILIKPGINALSALRCSGEL
jgi:hypothetical protein